MAENPRTAMRDALVEYADVEDTTGLHVAARLLAKAGEELLTWMETNGVDPGDPPSCFCGGEHWTCDWGSERE